jgi:hypothetical protein
MEGRFTLLTVSEISVHHDGKGVMEPGCSPDVGQEAEWRSNRKEPGQETDPKDTPPPDLFPSTTFHGSNISQW